MSGDLYLLNGLLLGAILYVTGRYGGKVLRVVWFALLMCVPFGIVAACKVGSDIARAIKKELSDGDST